MARPRTDTPTYSMTIRNGRYFVSWWEDGKNLRSSLRTNVQEVAKRRHQEFIAARNTAPKLATPTIRAILAGYLADRGPRVASPETMRHACAALTERMGDLTPDNLTRERARAYASARRKAGRRGATGKGQPLSNGTIIRELVTLRAALKWAMSERWIGALPYVELPPTPQPRERWLTRAEAEKLIAACERDGRGSPHVKLFVLLALYTAGRAGALTGLTWQQVDFPASLIRLGIGVGNKRRAVVPMGAKLRAVLLEAAEIRTTDYVIEFRGTKVASIRHSFREAATVAGLPGVTPHTLRHTAATWMVQGGTPLAQVARFLGDSEEMVEKVYGHHSPDYLRSAAAALEG